MSKRRAFSREFKLEVCRRIVSGEWSKTRTMRQEGLGAGTVERWLEQYKLRGEEAFDGLAWRPESQVEGSKVRELESALARAQIENQFLRDCLGKLRSLEGPSQK